MTKELIEEKVSKLTRDEAVSVFVEASIPAASVYQVDEVVRDPPYTSQGYDTLDG